MAFFNFKRKSVTPGTDNRKKRGIVRYFEIVFTKFSKLVLLNLVYFLCLFPALCGLVTIIGGLINNPEIIDQMYFLKFFYVITERVYSFFPPLAIGLFVLSALAYGPLTAGLTFCVRNLATGRHIWISDLFSRAKSNLKQGLAFGIIDIFVLFSLLLYISADLSALQGTALVMYRVLKIVSLIVSILYVCVRFYTYSITVTFELPIRDIFKNAFIFLVLGFFRNILAFVASFVIITSFVSTRIIDIILMGVLMFSFARFTAVFCTYPIIDKYMLKVKEKQDSDEE